MESCLFTFTIPSLALHSPSFHSAYGVRHLSFFTHQLQTSHPLIFTPPRRLCSSYYTLLTHAATTMPFREKMKRAFGTRPSDEGSELSFTQTSSSSSRRSRKEKKTRRKSSSNVYRPGEIMPKPKYPLAYNKAHQDKLLAYNFGDAWKKRKSVQSQYISPMGSRLPSARTSMAISRPQSYSASTTEQAADDGPTTITMNGDHSCLQVGNGECFIKVVPFGFPLGSKIGQGEKLWVQTKSLCGYLKREIADRCIYLMM